MPISSEPVVIIGASLAGSATAAGLARAGIPVILVDKDTFPRRKPCGEGLSARGRAELEELGFSLEQTNCPHLPLEGYRIHNGLSRLELSSHAGLIGIERHQLDWKLLEHVASFPNVEVLQGARAQVSCDSDGTFVTRVNGHSISTRLLVVADGAMSPTLRALRPGTPTHRTGRLGTSSQWRLTSGSIAARVHVFFVQGGEIYITPLAHNRVNISVLGVRSLVQPLAHLQALSTRVESISRALGIKLEATEMPLSSGAISTLYRGAQCRGAFVVGDACETLDPCAGFGMTHALISGNLAAQRILRALSSSDIPTELNAYEQERRSRLYDVRGFTRLTSATFTNGIGRAVLPFLVSSGLAALVSDSVHSHTPQSRFRSFVSLLGR
jgi:2-polyprenyl-6-methoxyphenol hydroxylase-like FAD-dependent oxidoreductase